MKNTFTAYRLAMMMFIMLAMATTINLVAGQDNSLQTGKEKYMILKVDFKGFSYHVGQNFYVRLFNSSTAQEVPLSRKSFKLTQSDFSIEIDSILFEKVYYGIGGNYNLDFYVDVNNNGVYDAPPADHSWRVSILGMKQDSTLSFSHNTNFTDIQWPKTKTPLKFYVDFKNMSFHVGESLYLRMVNQATGVEHRRKFMLITSPNFLVGFDDVEPGNAYNVDFYVDHNKNGLYDAPPADHAWRIQTNILSADTTITFAHSTNFTDIQWPNPVDENKYLNFTANFTNFSYHIGQNFYIRVINANTGLEIDNTLKQMLITNANFTVVFNNIPLAKEYWGMGYNYRIDFFVDVNKNGIYDPPPADHAWRISINNAKSDTSFTFAHNTSFVDIQWPTQIQSGVDENAGKITLNQNYPNPFSETSNINFSIENADNVKLELFDGFGNSVRTLVNQFLTAGDYKVNVDGSNLSSGIYFYRLRIGTTDKTMNMIVIK